MSNPEDFTRARYDAVIVLANLMDAEGNLNDETRARIDVAIEAIETGQAPLLVMCGWDYRDDSDICIADAMRSYAIEHRNVDASRVIVEIASRDTVGDAVFTRRNLAATFGGPRILVATSHYHAARTLEIFTFVYGPSFHIEITGAGDSATASQLTSEARSLDAFRTTFAGVKPGDTDAIFERLRERHPFYNGDVYPRA
ncbi:vancomycin permeability regulator SanA [Paraburkholderia sp. GAS333]|uniref:YdcF family protein n=1 Tax=Paraburkholderia sp. GAS333 TaxID=3156279 RepID=UPI003D23E5CE